MPMLKSRWKTIAAWLAVLIVLGVGGYFALNFGGVSDEH